jgi:D-3-phosphoglycerate dehydrogenase
MNAINAPVPVGEGAEFVAQFSELCETLGRVLYQLTDRPGSSLKIEYRGEISASTRVCWTYQGSRGSSPRWSTSPLNFVNTPALAKRGE